jgi:hypothetical protein
MQVAVILVHQHFPIHPADDLEIEGAGIFPVGLRISDLLAITGGCGHQQECEKEGDGLFHRLISGLYSKCTGCGNSGYLN